MQFNFLDFVVFFGYCLLVITLGLWVSRNKKGVKKDAKDYFLAGKALPWWAVGASVIAANISAEQFIGMSGSGFAIGMGIASYEFMAALTLIIVAAFFLPIFISKGVYTMPQFLEIRFDKRVRTVMALFWLAIFVFVNLSSILYLGALAVRNMMGVDLIWGIIGLAVFAAVYSIYGGLKAVAWTDVIQVVFLIGGGLVTTYVAFELLGYGNFFDGVKSLWQSVGPHTNDNRFDMILDKGHAAYKELPGLGVLIGGLWIANLYYWGCNQYIIQRALAAKSLDQAQRGLAFAGFLKILMPLLVVVPGIIAFVLVQEGRLDGIRVADDAYPSLLALVPTGVRGLAFAALIAAVVSSLATMINSFSTIFTMDVYQHLHKNASQQRLVSVGRIASIAALTVGVICAPLLSNFDQAFQYIQEFTGFVSPGALAIFLAGFFYKRATANGALAAAIGSFAGSALFKLALPGMPFMDRMGLVFLLCLGLIVLFALIEGKGIHPKAISLDRKLFKTSVGFKICAVVIVCMLTAIYCWWW
jgi:transporter, SSS family